MNMKKYTKYFLIIFISLVVLSTKVKALDYSKTYKEAFPNKEFRKLVLSCIHYNMCHYATNHDLDLDKNKNAYYILKIINEKNDPVFNKEIEEDVIEAKENDTLDKNALEKIQYLFNFKNTDPSKMKDLKGIEYLTKLEIIALKNIGAKTIDLNENKGLKHIILPKIDYDLPSDGSIFEYPHYMGENVDATLEDIKINRLALVRTLILNLNNKTINKVDVSLSKYLSDLAIDDSNLVDLKIKPGLPTLRNVSLTYNSLNHINLPTNIQYTNFRAGNQKIQMKIELNRDVDLENFDLDLDIDFTFKKANNLGAPMFFSPELPHLPTDAISTSLGRYQLKNLNVGEHKYSFMGVIEDYDNWGGTFELEVTKISTPPSIPPHLPPLTPQIKENPKTAVINLNLQLTIVLYLSIIIYFSISLLQRKNYL